jgi:tight adherence protein C
MELIWQYPELVGAALIAALLAVNLTKGHWQQNSLPPWLTEPASALISILPIAYVGKLVTWLNLAGYRNNSAFGALSSLKVYPCLSSALLFFVAPATIVLPLTITLFFVADLLLFLKVKKRQKQIRESLPQALDLMVLCVDAGLGLDAAIRRIASERTAISSALEGELLTLGRDILLGVGRERAYQELYNRTGVEELKALTSALNQSAKLGLSIARILRSQAEFQRTKLSQKAEEKAAKLPIYMAFPLWFCVMPALMVILLAPSIITFMQNVPSSIASNIVR